jgi:murein DD-endopeptidase MepM/ murein hydrolase activator NlpD
MIRALALSLFVAALSAAAPAAAIAGGPLLRDLTLVETSPEAKAPVATRIDWPICTNTGTKHGFTTDPFTGKATFHAGLDFKGKFGLSVFAAAPGRVIAAERRGPYGLMIEIDHGRGLRTRYAHLQSAAVASGALVRAGEKIATVGSSGRSVSAHLHFEVWFGDRLYDPRLFLKSEKVCPKDDGAPLPAPALRGTTAATPTVAGDKRVRFSWPVCTRTGTGFGYRFDPFTKEPSFHSGLDFPTAPGVAVRASATGRVIAAEMRGPYGNLIEIDHGYGYRTRYGHLQSYVVMPGEMVQRGQTIGAVGSTGRTTGPLLHFEIWFNDVVRDPRKLLEADPACTAD